MPKSRVFLLFLFLFLFIPQGIISAKVQEPDNQKIPELKSWIEGPVRYIATYKEAKEFKSLKTDRERNNFIYRFWQRRDPSPLTLTNEFRERFWERVVYSNGIFTESTKAGWMTDRGKIYIIAGAPSDREYIDNPDPSVSMGDMRSMGTSGHRGIERWTYQGLPSLKASPIIIVSFYKDATGEYKLSSNPEHFDEIAPGIVPPDIHFPDPFSPAERMPGGGSQTDERASASQSEMREAMQTAMDSIEEIDRLIALTQFQYDIVELTDTPSEEDLLKARVRTFEFYESAPQPIDFSLFQDVSGQPYVTLSVTTSLKNFYKDEVANDAVLPITVFGNLKDASDPENQLLFTSDPFVPNHIVREKDELRLLTSLPVPPGTYDAMLGVQDMLSGKIVLYQSKVVIPSFDKGKVSMSDIILASRIEEGPKTTLSPIPGNLHAIQKVQPIYTKQDELTFFFQIYDVARDPATELPNIEISCQFSTWKNDSFEKIGSPLVFPDITTQEYGRSFPLQKFPQGKYKIEISVKDTLSGTSDSKEMIFEVK